MKAARDKNENEIGRIREKFEEKKLIMEQKKQQFEKEKLRKIEENQKKSLMHQQLIARVMETNE